MMNAEGRADRLAILKRQLRFHHERRNQVEVDPELPAEEMEIYPVSTKVNSPENDGPECIESLRALFSGERTE